MDKETVVRPGDDEDTLAKVTETTDLEELSQKEERYIYHCGCGAPVDPGAVERCSSCRETIVCGRCKITMDTRTLCRECTEERFHDLDRTDLKILLGVEKGVHDTGTLAKLTGLERQEVEARIDELKNPLIGERRVLLGLIKVNNHLTPEGEQAVEAFTQIYDGKALAEFKNRLRATEVLR